MERYESKTRSLHCEEEERRTFYAFFGLKPLPCMPSLKQ